MGMYPLSLLESRVAAQGMELCIDSRKATPGCVFAITISIQNAWYK